MNTFIKGWDRKQAADHLIMDQHFITMIAAERSAQAERRANTLAWVSAGAGIVGAIAAILALF